MEGLTRDDSSEIAFVVACYLANAIDTAELRRWAEHVVASRGAFPAYVLDLLDFDAPRFHVYRVLGFTPDRGLSGEESAAISGLAYARGRAVHDGPTREAASRALARRPEIGQEFARVFPFVGEIGPGS